MIKLTFLFSQENWKPKADDVVEIEGMSPAHWGTWKVSLPKVYNKALVTFGIQVTAPMPLSGIQDLIRLIDSDDKKSPFRPGSRKPAVLVSKSDMEKLNVFKKEDINDDFLGFFSLVLSYAKAASTAGSMMKDNGPKQLINIMTRTDFGTLYKMYVKDAMDDSRCRSKKKKEDLSLFTVVKDLVKARKVGLSEKEMDGLKFMWAPPSSDSIPPEDKPDPPAQPPAVGPPVS